MGQVAKHAAAAAATATAFAAAAVVAPVMVGAVDTEMAISTTSVDFGTVDVGSSASITVTLTNTGGDAFGPINMVGGAPPSDEFGASQNCQSATLPTGGTCSLNFSFSPGSAGSFNDTSSFTVRETANQSDGEDFSVSLTGATPAAAPTTTTSMSPGPDSTSPAAAPGTASPSDATTTMPMSTAEPRVWPLTGIGVGPWPALVVVVDNVNVEVQTGLNSADIVFELLYEGGASRFLAVFNSMEANPVGPIRSGRLHDIELLLCLNDPAIAYSGANEGVEAALQGAGFELLGQDAPGFFRRDDLDMPHNPFANTNELWPQLVSSGNAVPIFLYIAPGSSTAGEVATFVELMVGTNAVRWDWDPAKGVFLRSQAGSAHELTEGQASADNVIVLVTEYATNPDGGPNARTVGSGEAVVYSDGLKIEGTWSRNNPEDPFTLEADGEPILLSPGRTWVEIVDDQHNLTDG